MTCAKNVSLADLSNAMVFALLPIIGSFRLHSSIFELCIAYSAHNSVFTRYCKYRGWAPSLHRVIVIYLASESGSLNKFAIDDIIYYIVSFPHNGCPSTRHVPSWSPRIPFLGEAASPYTTFAPHQHCNNRGVCRRPEPIHRYA